jgi:hypothetical protein
MIVGAKNYQVVKIMNIMIKSVPKDSFPKDNDNIIILAKNCSLNKCLLVLSSVHPLHYNNYVKSDKKLF